MLKPMLTATLYLGANIPNPEPGCGTYEVSSEQFASFLSHVTPHFPGFTVVDALGYWKGTPERVRVLTIIAEDASATREQIRILCEQYKTMFAQEAVIYSLNVGPVAMNVWPHGPVAAYHKPGKGY